MVSGLVSVDIHAAGIVHRAKAQQDPLFPHVLRKNKGPLVPDHRMDGVRRSDAAQLGLICKGNHDLSIQRLSGHLPAFREADIFIVKGKRPGPVQVHPVFPHEVRSRVFWAWGEIHGLLQIFHNNLQICLIYSNIFGIVH